MTLSGDILYASDLKIEYEYQINKVFALLNMSDKYWNCEDDYQSIYEKLMDAQKEARRIDGIRDSILKIKV